MNFPRSGWRWMGAVAVFAFTTTVATASMMLFRHLQLAGESPHPGAVLAWQAIIYSAWLPIAAILWRRLSKSGLTRRAIRWFLLVGLATIPLHVLGGTFLDIAFSTPGSADLIAMVVQRAQLDLLIYLSFGTLLIAAEFHRRAAEESAAATAIRTAMARAGEVGLNAAGSPSADKATMAISSGSKRLIVPLHDIEWFGSAANYVVVNWAGREGLVRRTLQALEQELDPLTFARIHRTTIANLSKVRAAESLSDGSWRLRMESGTELVASRTYRSKILDRLKIR